MTSPSSLRRAGVVAGLVLAGIGLTGLLVGPAAGQDPDGAGDGLVGTVRAVYDADPATRPDAVGVRFEYAFANPVAGIAFPGFFESLPATAVDVVARRDGGTVSTAAIGEADGFVVWAVEFADPLGPGELATATLEWSWPAGGDGVVVEPGAVAFPAYVPVVGDAAPGELIVRAAPGLEPRLPSVEAQAPPTAAAGPVDYPVPVDAAYTTVDVVLLDPARATVRQSDGPPVVTIEDYAADGEWATSVADRLAVVSGRLDRWFGPRSEPFRVRRVPTGAAADPFETLAAPDPLVELDSDDVAEIDRHLALAWLAPVPVDDDWVREGFAAAFAGVDAVSAPGSAIAVVADEIGSVGVRAVVDRLRAGTITYEGATTEPQPIPPDWRTVLDLLEGVGGATDAATVFLGAVVDSEGADAIGRRAAARTDYLALADRAAPWSLPAMVRVPMAAWEFETFTARQAAVSEAIATRDGLDAWAEELGLAAIAPARPPFETARESMEEVDTVLAEQAAALAAYDEAERLVNGDRGLLAWLGLWGSDPSAELDELAVAWADGDLGRVEAGGESLAHEVERAVGRGTVRLLIPLALAGVALWALRRWRSHRRADAPPAA